MRKVSTVSLPWTCAWLGCSLMGCAAPAAVGPGQPPAPSETTPHPAPSAASAVAPRASGTPGGPDPTTADGVVLTTYFEALRADGRRGALVSGQSLRSGERFWMHLGARERLHVYVIYAGADGSATVVYPETGELALEPGVTVRVPDAQDFELDDVTGWERILVIGSRAPLARTEGELDRLIREIRVTHRWPESTETPTPSTEPLREPSTAVTPRPKTASLASTPRYSGPAPIVEPTVAGGDVRGATRGILLSPKAGRIEAVPDAQGLVVIPLAIRHVP